VKEADASWFTNPIYICVAVESAPDICDVFIAPAIVRGPVQPRIQPPGHHVLCGGSTRQLTLPLSYTSYRWSNGSEQESLTVASPGEYFVTVTDQNGCTIQSDTVLISLADSLNPMITPDSAVTFCEGRRRGTRRWWSVEQVFVVERI
jgi:hypothetical protein